MTKGTKEVLQAAVLGFGIPAILLIFAVLFTIPVSNTPKESNAATATTPLHTQQTDPQYEKMQIQVLIDGESFTMDMESYVVGVVLSEMPASFHMEALKAQAVAARTYAIKTSLDGKKHGGAVCGSHTCCQGFMTVEDYLLRGWKAKYVQRVQQAVMETAGQIVTYEDKPIRATYFSCSGGSTEAAVTVWGREYPYLQSVESPGEEETVYYTHRKIFTPEEFQEKLGIVLTGTPQSWFGMITYTSGGGIDSIVIGGTAYRGTTLRSLLELRSTVFQVVVSEETITFETKGYGHRVGMSQYGADAMAKEGYTYEEILRHYYVETRLQRAETLLT